jgi:hypothetical protein
LEEDLMADPVRDRAEQLDQQLRHHLEALLCQPSLLEAPELLWGTAAALSAAAPAAEALQTLTSSDQPQRPAETAAAVAAEGATCSSITSQRRSITRQRSDRVPVT